MLVDGLTATAMALAVWPPRLLCVLVGGLTATASSRLLLLMAPVVRRGVWASGRLLLLPSRLQPLAVLLWGCPPLQLPVGLWCGVVASGMLLLPLLVRSAFGTRR